MKKVLFLGDSLVKLKYKTDTTICFIESFLKKETEVFYCEDIFFYKNSIFGYVNQIISVNINLDINNYIQLKEAKLTNLNDFDCIVMRKDPPVDDKYLNYLHLLEVLENKGLLVVNSASALKKYNEKIATIYFAPEFIPETLITSDKEQILTMLAQEKRLVIKPINEMAGQGILHLIDNDKNKYSIIEMATLSGKKMVIVQKIVEDYVLGDKRVLIIGGEVYPYGLNRIPKSDEVRSNLAAGGVGEVFQLSKSDLKIANHIALQLKKNNILFAGIDILGDKLTEINITSPTGVRQIQNNVSQDIGLLLYDRIFNI